MLALLTKRATSPHACTLYGMREYMAGCVHNQADLQLVHSAVRDTLVYQKRALMAAKPCPGALPAASIERRKVPRCASQAFSVS